jgi:hypothetical protein
MKTFAKYDYYIQFFFLVIGPQFFIIGGLSGWILFYFIVGIPQLISFLIKIFLKTQKTPMYFIYGLFILPVWISILLKRTVELGIYESNILENIILLAFFYSPFLAALYVYENYKVYKSLKS